MFKFLIFLTACFIAASSKSIDNRIVGGNDAKRGQFPYIVSLQDFNNEHFCGGSIINEYWILTAAHCIIDVQIDSFTIVTGTLYLSDSGDRYWASKLFFPENFDPEEIDPDLALIKLRTPMRFSQNVQSIPLGDRFVDAGEDAVVAGWGYVEDFEDTDVLQYLNNRVIATVECQVSHEYPVYDYNICTFTRQGKGACFGDSGGPLVSGGKQIGIVNWGIPCGLGYPDVYLRVSSFIGWINKVIQEN